MSQYFLLGDVTLWNPSNGVSAVFLRQVAMFEDVLGIPSGIGPMESDEAQVVPVVFQSFVVALLAWRGRSNHPVLEVLSDGFVATVLVLAERSGIESYWPGAEAIVAIDLHDIQVGTSLSPVGADADWAARVRDQAEKLGRSMAR